MLYDNNGVILEWPIPIPSVLGINECQSNPCINGNCIDQINQFHCNCFGGYTGKICSEGLFYYKNILWLIGFSETASLNVNI